MQYRLPFGGGSGAGVTINPIAFLVIQSDNVKLMPVNYSSSLDKMMDYLKSENENATDEEPMKDIYFWNIQESGKSQSQLVEMLNDRVNQKYGCGIRTGKLMSEKYYVYLDDGLYTGSRLRKDIKRCIEMIPEGSRIDVIYMIACQSGLDFSKRKEEYIKNLLI